MACLSDLKAELLTRQGDGAGEITEKSVAESIREKLEASGLSDAESEDSFAENRRGTSSARLSARSRHRTSSAKLMVFQVHLKGHDVFATLWKNKFMLQYSPENLQSFVSLAKAYSQEDADEKNNEKAERRQIAAGDTWLH